MKASKGEFFIHCEKSSSCRGKLFRSNKPYKILTASPYLTCQTEVPNIFAFVDTGFNGNLATLPKELNFRHKKLTSQNVVYVGTQAMARFGKVFINYEAHEISFLCNDSNIVIKELGGEKVNFSSTFSKWDTMPLISFKVIITEKKNKYKFQSERLC